MFFFFFFSSRRRHTRCSRDWSSDVCSSDLAMVDGVYQDIAEALKPGVKESEIVALATSRLYQMGSDCVEAINSISGERCSPHPHNFTDRLIRPGDQAFFNIIQSFMGYRTCYYRT